MNVPAQAVRDVMTDFADRSSDIARLLDSQETMEDRVKLRDDIVRETAALGFQRLRRAAQPTDALIISLLAATLSRICDAVVTAATSKKKAD